MTLNFSISPYLNEAVSNSGFSTRQGACINDGCIHSGSTQDDRFSHNGKGMKYKPQENLVCVTDETVPITDTLQLLPTHDLKKHVNNHNDIQKDPKFYKKMTNVISFSNIASAFQSREFITANENKENSGEETPVLEYVSDLPLNENNVLSARNVNEQNIINYENEKHSPDKSNVTSISCDICGNQFNSIYRLRTHHFTCIKDKPYEYTECDEAFSYKDVFKIHLCKHLCLNRNSSKIHSNMISETDIHLKSEPDCFESENDVEFVKNLKFEGSVSGGDTQLSKIEENEVSNGYRIIDNDIVESTMRESDDPIVKIRNMHYSKDENSINVKPAVSRSAYGIHGKKFTKQSNLNNHCSTNTKDKLYSCAECNKQFSCIDNLNRHLGFPWKKPNTQDCCNSASHEDCLISQIYTKVLVSKPYVKQHFCDICGKNFKTKDLLVHLSIHMSVTPHKCSQCDKPFICEDALQRHLRTHSSKKSSQDLKKKKYTCKICTASFVYETKLNIHLRIHTNAREFKCNLCGKGFNQNSTLKTHMLTHSGKRAHECSICNKSFRMKCSLNRHLQRHAGDKPHQCDVCHYKFTFIEGLKVHYRKHTGELPFVCDICQKRFRRRSGLNAHIASHTGNQPHKCDVCQKKFFYKFALIAHSQIHTKGKIFACSICDKSYSTNYALIEHRRVHTGEKPYVCNYCNKEFSRKHAHDRHIWIHTGKKPYECKICKRFFNQKNSLQRHQVVHTKEKPYSCNICQKSFTQKSYLSSHKLTHSEEQP